MKQFFVFLAGLMTGAVAVQASLTAPDLMARIHFAGAGRVSADTNAVAFTNLWCSPEAQALREQTLTKLSRAPGVWFKSKITAGAGDGAAQLRPLLDDLLKSEWLFEMRDATNGSPGFALAIRLDAVRAQLWQGNLQNLLESWTKLAVKKIPGGWELRKHEPPDLIRCTRAGDWVVVDCGQDQLSLGGEILEPFSGLRPHAGENSWLTAHLDWPRLAHWFPALEPLGLPSMDLRVKGTNGNLRLNGKFTLSQPLPPLEPWRVPTNTIHQPLLSFTAVRGIAPWLEKQNWAQPYEISPAPDQAFIWALAQMPLQTFLAVPVLDASNALAQFDQKLSAHTNWQTHFMMPLTMTMTNNEISWTGLPFIAPNLRAVHEPSGDFLFAGLFPNSPKIKTVPPPPLFTQLGQAGLVYYHWEITADRLKQLPGLTQLGLMLTRHKQLDSQSAAGKWLDRVGPALGNTVTEVTETAPDELTFTRLAPGGLTAVELVALANWLEAGNFPGCDLRLPVPARPLKINRLHPQKPGAPFVPPPVH